MKYSILSISWLRLLNTYPKPHKNYNKFSGNHWNTISSRTEGDNGEHQLRYYGWYSNKRRGMNSKRGKPKAPPYNIFGPDEYWEKLEPDTAFRKKCRMTWAALIKCVYEVDPLKCPVCGGTMKVISFVTIVL